MKNNFVIFASIDKYKSEKISKMKKFLLFAVLLVVVGMAQANVTLPSVFTDNMVLQQQTTLKLHGKASPNTSVSVQTGWSRTALSVQADATGNWALEIRTPKAGGPYTLTFDDGSPLVLKNVMVGEVWLGSGQSNMEMPVEGWGKVLNFEEEIKNANYPNIRLFQVKKVVDLKPRDCFSLEYNMGGWQECSPTTIPNFSALCYFYALRLWEELKVPIGVIDDDWGGTPVEAWTRTEVLESVYGSVDRMAFLKSKNYDFNTLKAIYQSKKTLADNGQGGQPGYHENPEGPHFPGSLWNAMMAPLVDFPLRGFIWYQGCTNVGHHDWYAACFQAMIEDWREQFGNPEMPFYFVQLANYLQPSDLQPDSWWALLRESQADALCLKNTGMAVNIDLGDAKDIHPKTKRELGRRLAAVALHNTYGKKVPYTAPVYDGYSIQEDGVHIRFSLPEGSEAFNQDENLPGFIIADMNRKWHVAKACTKGNEVIVSSPDVKRPLAVRYGWADNPTCTLKTKSNFHVAPFRTDRW